MFKNLTITAFLGFITIILGAFGAHALQDTLDETGMKSFETAVRYQFYHIIVLLIVNGFDFLTEKQKNSISYCFFLGIFLFSGSIYMIQLTPISVKSIWFITPLGGLFFIAGWGYLFSVFLKKTYKSTKKL